MSKITAYASATVVHPDDQFIMVDVHDTSMAATGTDKKVGALLLSTVTSTVVSSNANITTAAQLYLVNATSNLTLILPSPSTVTGIPFWIKRTDDTASVVTVKPNASELIDGANSSYMENSLSSGVYISDGTNWWTL